MMSSIDTTSLHVGGGSAAIFFLHPDIMKTDILCRLDGPTLVTVTCVSSELHALFSDQEVWRGLCAATWPSTEDPLVSDVISAFPSGHRSFFSDSFPELDDRRSFGGSPATARLISAVDVFYKEKIIFSRVHVSETQTGWFECSPFRVDLVGHNEPIPIRHGGATDTWLDDLEQNLTLSWIIIDPTRKRSVNISSRSPVSVNRHWMTRDVQVRYGTVLSPGKAEVVNCSVVVTCCGKEGGEMHVCEMSMHVEDMDGKVLNGKDSLVILQGAIEGRRRKRREGQNSKNSFGEFEEMKLRKRKAMQRLERILDFVCIASAVSACLTLLSFVFFG